MKKISILLAGALLLCGCQRALIQPDSVKAIYVQADFETERTPVSGSLQDDLLEVLSSLSFASAEAEETPEGVRIDVEEEDGTLSFYCGDDAMIGVRGPDEDPSASHRTKRLPKRCAICCRNAMKPISVPSSPLLSQAGMKKQSS